MPLQSWSATTRSPCRCATLGRGREVCRLVSGPPSLTHTSHEILGLHGAPRLWSRRRASSENLYRNNVQLSWVLTAEYVNTSLILTSLSSALLLSKVPSLICFPILSNYWHSMKCFVISVPKIASRVAFLKRVFSGAVKPLRMSFSGLLRSH